MRDKIEEENVLRLNLVFNWHYFLCGEGDYNSNI